MSEPNKRPRGKRRADAVVERDQVTLAEKITVEGKSATEAGAELGLQPSTAQRLAARGLREMLNTPANQMKLEALFSVFISGFTESLEDLQSIIEDYKSRGKNPPIKAILAKVQTLLGAAKVCGFGTDNTFINTGDQVAPAEIVFTVVPRRGTPPLHQATAPVVCEPQPTTHRQLNAAPEPIAPAEVAPQVQIIPPPAPRPPRLSRPPVVLSEAERKAQAEATRRREWERRKDTAQMEENRGELTLRGGPPQDPGIGGF
jgi:hypothetical protein